MRKTKTIRKLEKDILKASGITKDIFERVKEGVECNTTIFNFYPKELYYFEAMHKLGLIKKVPSDYGYTSDWSLNLTPKAKRLYNQLKKEGYFGK